MSGQLPLLREDPTHEFRTARRTTLRDNYDPSAYPPDLQFAREHGQAQRVGQRIAPLENVARCRCCLEPVHKTPLPLLCEPEALSHCGQSTPLYLYFVRQCMLLLTFNLFMLALPSTLLNLTMGSECKEVDGPNGGFFSGVCRLSVLNIMNVEIIDAMEIQAVLNFTAVLGNIFFIAYLQIAMQRRAKHLRTAANAGDYSVMVQGLPADISLTELQKYLQDKLLYSGAPDLTIVKIYPIYNFKQYLTLQQSKQQLLETAISLQHQLAQSERKNLECTNYQRKLEIQTRITGLEGQLRKTNKEIQNREVEIGRFQAVTMQLAEALRKEGALESAANRELLNFSGKCIVTLNNLGSRTAILQTRQPRSCFQGIAAKLSELLQGKKSKIVLSPAPQPADIIFANLGSRRKTVWGRRALYSVVIILLVGLDFLVVAVAKKFLKEEKAIQEGSIIFSFINSIMVSIFCSIFRRVVRASEAESCYDTLSKLSYESVAKLVMIFEVNMLFTTFVANAASFYLVRQETPTFAAFPLNFESFLFDVFFLISTNPLFTIFLTLFDHRHLRSLLLRFRITKQWVPVSQGGANLAFENMHFDVCHKYGTIYRFVIFTAGISVIFPLAVVICLAALGGLYWVDKFLLLRRYSITERITRQFSLMAHRLLGQFPVYMSLTNLLVMFIPIQDGSAFQGQKYSKAYYYLSLIALAISLLTYWIGDEWAQTIVAAAIGTPPEMASEIQPKTYRELETEFEVDYSHNYPYFRVSRQVQAESDNFRKDKLKEMRDNQKLGIFEVIRSNMHHHPYS